MKKYLKHLILLAGLFLIPFTILTGLSQNDTLIKSDSVKVVEEFSEDSAAVVVNTSTEKESLANVVPEKATFSFSLVRLLRGLLGMLVLIAIAWAFSTDRKSISWKVVGIGLVIQLILAISILYIPFVQSAFEIVGKLFVKVLEFTGAGVKFLFGSGDSGEVAGALQTFAVNILPTIIFFSAITSVLFYLGVIQIIVRALGYAMSRAMGLSGAESLSVAGNIFLGQTESPLMIKAYLENMNESEMMLVMSGGMATLAGGVLAAYIGFLGGDDPQQQLVFAKHLLTASVMAAPGVVVISKILVPQTKEVDKTLEISKTDIGKNVLDAISNGTTQGFRLAVNVAAMLLVFIAFIALINYVFIKIGGWTSLNDVIANVTNGRYDELSLEFILGYGLSPLMWLIGVPREDITLVGTLLGQKLIMTEFIGYVSLSEMKASGMFSDPKSIIMSVYMLCGFANFASIGIQIGGIGALAPGKRVLLSKLGMRALLAGTLASLLSATIVGILMG